MWVLSHFSCVQLFVTLQAVALQAPLSMGFCRQEYWNGLPCPPPGDFLTQESNPHLLHWQAGFFVFVFVFLPLEPPGRAPEQTQLSAVQLLSRVPLFATP